MVSARSDERSEEPRSRDQAKAVSARSDERSEEPRSRDQAKAVSARSDERSEEPRSRDQAKAVSARSDERSEEPRSRDQAKAVAALVFDCDGVLADTERYGHLPAFNATFERYGLPVRWSEEEYAEKLTIGGGKERMASLFADPDFVRRAGIPSDEAKRTELLATWHRTKTAIFKQLVAEGRIPPRPGTARIIRAALAQGWTVAVASTSAEESVRAVLETAVGADTAGRVPVFAGDIVPAKKPDPAIYRLVVDRLGLDPAAAMVVEDSRNGLLAATGAGLPCLVTVNGYTRDEDFTEAVLVVSELGDPGRPPIEVLANRSPARPGDHLTLDDLRAALGVPEAPAGGGGGPGEVHEPEEGGAG
jgi:HAD superfamily hydrolase (TIGR01509 family)